MRLTRATRRGSIGARPNLQKFQRACRVFLARLLMVHGCNAPEVLRRIALHVNLDNMRGLERETVTAQAAWLDRC